MKAFKYILFLCAITFPFSMLNAQPKPGEIAYEITLRGQKGDTISLSSLQGKVVLIDFWASWCGPCRMSNRKLVKLYARYKSKGFEIFGVSLDENKKDWLKAIKKDKTNWIQVVDDRGSQAPTAIDWNLYQIPSSYLINKNGVVVAVDPETNDLEKALKDLLNH